MGYGDYTPSGGGRPKPLTKAQMRKMQQAYLQAGAITEEVRKKELEEQKQLSSQVEDELNMI